MDLVNLKLNIKDRNIIVTYSYIFRRFTLFLSLHLSQNAWMNRKLRYRCHPVISALALISLYFWNPYIGALNNCYVLINWWLFLSLLLDSQNAWTFLLTYRKIQSFNRQAGLLPLRATYFSASTRTIRKSYIKLNSLKNLVILKIPVNNSEL